MNMNEIISIILSLIGVVLTSAVIPYIRAKTTVEKKKRIYSLIQIAVTAAEQVIQGENKGNERFGYVLTCVENCGIKLDGSELKAIIESEVYNLNNIPNRTPE